jgi:hypothetical protein
MTGVPHSAVERTLREFALSFPGASAWGKRFIRSQGRIFVSLQRVDGALVLGVKLPTSSEMALTLPFVKPAGRNLGPAGWVTARLEPGRTPDIDLLKGWIEQSYRAATSSN